jgi:hypothetical protein
MKHPPFRGIHEPMAYLLSDLGSTKNTVSKTNRG